MKFFKEPLSISLDIDGVLVDNFPYWKALFDSFSEEHNHSPRVIPGKDAPYWDYFYSVCQECWKVCLNHPEMVKSYDLRPSAKEVVAWFKDLGVTLPLVTSRPTALIGPTEEWAKDVLGDIVSEVVVTNNKVEACTKLGVKYHLEDAPHHLSAFNQQGIVKPIIWNAPYNKTIEGDRIDTWEEFATYILWRENKLQ